MIQEKCLNSSFKKANLPKVKKRSTTKKMGKGYEHTHFKEREI